MSIARKLPRVWVYRWRGVLPIPFLISVVLFFPPTYRPHSLRDFAFDLCGLALIGGGLAVRVWAVGHAGPQTRSYKLRAPRLVTGGPYAYVRNPIYLGNFLIGLGVVTMTESWFALAAFAGLFALEYGLLVSLEEEFLRERFGEAYGEYCHNVSRWVPRFSPARLGPPSEFSFRAVRKEYQAVLSALAMVGLVQTSKFVQRLFLS